MIKSILLKKVKLDFFHISLQKNESWATEFRFMVIFFPMYKLYY